MGGYMLNREGGLLLAFIFVVALLSCNNNNPSSSEEDILKDRHEGSMYNIQEHDTVMMNDVRSKDSIVDSSKFDVDQHELVLP